MTTETLNATVAIVQPYIPHYRVPFFQELQANLRRESVACIVLSGRPTGGQDDRRDSSGGHPWSEDYRPRRLTFSGHTVDLGGSRTLWKKADAVILGLQGTLLDTYSALLVGRRRRAVGLWGHVGSYVNAPNYLDHTLESWQARSADRIFAYTQSGARAAIEMGVSESRVTTVMNSLDTSALLHAYSRLSRDYVDEWMTRQQLTRGKTVAFVGGIDGSKRIDLLAEAMDILWARDPEIKLILGGRGTQEALLAASVARGQTVSLGYVDDLGFATLAAAADVLAIPGRVGLVAVQALALGIPIATTDYPYHAPEFEYLVPNESVFVTEASAARYADLLQELVELPRRVSPGSWKYPTLKDMVANYAAGVMKLIR